MNRYLVDGETLRVLVADLQRLSDLHTEERNVRLEVAIAVAKAILDGPPVSVQAIGRSLHTGPVKYARWRHGCQAE